MRAAPARTGRAGPSSIFARARTALAQADIGGPSAVGASAPRLLLAAPARAGTAKSKSAPPRERAILNHFRMPSRWISAVYRACSIDLM